MYNPSKPFKHEMLRLIQQTWNTPHVEVSSGIYPIVKKKFSYLEIDHTDGIGSKAQYHWKKKTFKAAVLDALAMNLNDLALARATPYKLQNHLAMPEDNHEIMLEIIKHLSEECKKRNIAITGGETTQQASSFDITITLSGFIPNIKENKTKKGDVIIGIKSSGLHSNGFTRIREIFKEEIRKEFAEPTLIYADTILELDKRFTINGMMHMTGGAFTKLKDIAEKVDLEITRNHSLHPQPIFQELSQKGIQDEEMYRTFNCGIGFILSTLEEESNEIIKEIKKAGFQADIIGKALSGTGKIKIQSMFSNKIVEF